jgi:hypothetical protein
MVPILHHGISTGVVEVKCKIWPTDEADRIEISKEDFSKYVGTKDQ